MSVSAHEILKVTFCKKPACVDEARWTVGRLAGLCERHGAEANEAFARDRAKAAPVRRESVAKLASVTALRDQLRLTLKAERAVRVAAAAGRNVSPTRVERLEAARTNLKLVYLECGLTLGLIERRAA